MCGIAGFAGPGGQTELAAMTARISHRGPDADGFFHHGRIHLGHRRLSIIDLTCGAQPMATTDGSLVVVFNGEIYNHADLRAQLIARGHVFSTDHSDTEVLLHGWKEWGRDMLPKLNGMWAFAICDTRTGSLFLSRDRFGKKPLYYFHDGETFVFASELTALLAHPTVPRNESALARVKFFAHALIPAPHTPFERVWKLPAGHWMEFTDEHLELRRWWRYKIEPVEDGRSEDELAAELRETLARAVRRRLVADVPLGIFLSGGIDSSAVAALASRDATQLQTFTIGFSEPSFDESEPARRMAEFLHTQHHEDRLDLDAALSHLPAIFDLLDEPQGDSSLLPTWLLCRFARRHVTVALGGDGGDELFAGYDPFRALGAAEAYARLVPRPLHRAIRLLASRLPVSHANMSWDFKIKRTLRGLAHPAPLWNPVWLGALEPAELHHMTGCTFSIEEIYSEAIEAWESCAADNAVDRTLQFFTEIYLQDGILAKADRASMMNSLEVRSPFLDIEVADFARRLPHRYKLNGGTTKYLVKKALAGVLPDDIIHRRKKGFGTPIGAWLRSGRLAPERRSDFIAKKSREHLDGRADERLFLWCETVWQEWQKRLP